MAKHVYNPTTDDAMRSCLTKHRYRDENQALAMARKAKARRGTDLRVYWCPFCSGFHLTSSVVQRKDGDT